MIATSESKGARSIATRRGQNGRAPKLVNAPSSSRAAQLWTQFGPFLVTSLFLMLGYFHYAPGTAYSLSAEHYRTWSFPAFRYSDVIWLYLRDGLDRRPLPYLDYSLEYPPLTGLISWLLSFAPDLPAYFALAYGVLAASALLTVWALQRIAGANVWLFAASPALFFYTGHQWDMAAVGMAALGLLSLQRGRDGRAVLCLIVATSLKLFPAVFVAASVVERVRDRRYRSAAGIALTFSLGTLAINLPVMLATFEGWSFFFHWNRDRLADSGIWVLWRDASTADLTRWSLVAALAGGVALTTLAFRSRGPVVIPLGATYLLWWLLVNKTFTTHLMLWAILSIALLSAPWWIWGMTTAMDLVGFQLGNYLNLYNVPEFRHSPLIRKAVENIYDPVQLARSAVLLVSTLWGVHVLNLAALRDRYQTQLPTPRQRATARLAENPAPHPGSINLPAHTLLVAMGIGLAFSAATIAMTWPYARHLSDSTVVGFDPYLQIWLSEWIQHVLFTNPVALYDANIFFPFPQTLAYTDANIPGALAAAPLRWLTGDPILTNSILVLATFVLAAAGMHALVVYYTGNRSAGFVAGLAYAFLPYRMIHLWHLNWLEGALLPWVLLALFRLIDRPSTVRGATFGALAGVLVLISFYFSVQIALMGLVILLVKAIALKQIPGANIVRAGGVAIAIGAAIAVPLYVPYLNVREEQQLERTIVDAEQYKALPESYLQLAPWDTPHAVQRLLGVRAGPNESLTDVGQAQHADNDRHPEIVIEDALYPGSIAASFAVVGVIFSRNRRWLTVSLLVIGFVAALLSLGPTFGPRHGDGPPLPYGWLFDNAPFFRSMRVPARLGGLTDLMVVLLAGLGIAWSWDRLRKEQRFSRWMSLPATGPLLTVLLATAVLAELWTGSIPLEPVDRGANASAAADWLVGQPSGPVMEFPAESVFADPAAASVRRHYGEALFWSTRHWKPLVNGNSGFIPRAYSDFIERFVGEVVRPDGSITPRISHVDEETTRLLDQIGIRYLVFHRPQYRSADWPAVASGLATLVENGTLTSAGEHGEASIFVVNPNAPGVSPPRMRLFAPTLITPESVWAPWVAIDSPAGTPAALALSRPSRLETSWYDDDGRLLWRDATRMPLPAVLDEPQILCSARECLTSRPFNDLSLLPPPDPLGSWSPRETGHYIVRLRLTGDQALECQVDLDLVDDANQVQERSNEDVYRWAECRDISENPVNNPGAKPFTLSPPSVTLVDGEAVVDIAVTSRGDDEIRGWFILAPPDDSQPWINATYQSQVQQKLLPAGDPVAFEWTADIGSEVDPGIYALTVWFHRRGAGGWGHAVGGEIELAPIVVSENRTLRWAGPIRARLARTPEPLEPGVTAKLELSVTGSSNRIACAAEWQLFSGNRIAATGNAKSCFKPEITPPLTIEPGTYRLQIDLFGVRDNERFLSDAVSVPVVVVDEFADGGPS